MNALRKYFVGYGLLWGFALLMGGLFVIDLLTADSQRSELENRRLKQRPAFSLVNLLHNEYTKEYEEYINDQFVFRDNWITLKSVFETALGKVENNGVVYGDDHYLFNKLLDPALGEGRSNGVGFGGDDEQAAPLPVLDEAQLSRNVGFLSTFRENYQGHITLALAPNSYGVLREKLPKFLPALDQREVIDELYRQAVGVDTLDLFAPLEEAAKEGQVYYRNDHHWTTDGAWVGYRAYCQSCGLPYAELEELAPYRWEEPGFLGTYYNKSKNFDALPDTLVWYDIPVEDVTIDGEHSVLQSDGTTTEVTGIYQVEKFSTRDKYAAFLYGNNGMTILYSNNSCNKLRQNGRTSRVLLIKDSYGNCFAPFLTYSYDEVWVADLRNMTFKISEVVAQNEFDDVLILYNLDSFQEDRNFSRITY